MGHVARGAPVIDPASWHGRRVLVTGHTGFKGAWLVAWLRRLGAEVHGLALAPDAQPNLYEAAGTRSRCASEALVDVRDRDGVARVVADARPEVVLHLAAQPLVRRSYEVPVDTFAVNAMGTAHVLEALRGRAELRAVVVVTTDKVYENHDTGEPFRERDPLGGHDPYSASKAAAEIVAASYRGAFFGGGVVATARSGNVVGGGDWNVDRIVPDAIRAWSTGRELVVRNPAAVRPWQHVIEPLAGYLLLAQGVARDPSFARAWNFGPDPSQCVPVADLVDALARAWGPGAAHRVVTDHAAPREAALLRLDATDAQRRLGWSPRWDLETCARLTVAGYRAQLDGGDVAAAMDACFAAFGPAGGPA